MEFISVPAGCFQMGSKKGRVNEKPVHKVCVDGFKLGKYEVTRGQWRAVMGDSPSRVRFRCVDCPVEWVSWNGVQDYIRRLNAQGSAKFRLPTEAEWEYACRSGGKDEIYCGGNEADRVAWYSENSGGTRRVGTKAANRFGLHDMSGNVWESVQDGYGENYYGQSPTKNPQGSDSSRDRVYRGGGWNSSNLYLRSSERNRLSPGSRSDNLGFRLVRQP
jgi:formylglycine-generating enzyme required for sulfatase activity